MTMKLLSGLTASFLLVSLMGGLAAVPSQAPTLPESMTILQARAAYGRPDSIYLDGKGGSFWLFTLKRGQKLMIQVAPQDKPMKLQFLPWSWRPAPGGHVLKTGGGDLTFIPAPRRSLPAVPAVPVPTDRYHPGVKLLARSGRG